MILIDNRSRTHGINTIYLDQEYRWEKYAYPYTNHTQSYDEGLSNWTTMCFESQAFGYNIEDLVSQVKNIFESHSAGQSFDERQFSK